MNLREALQGVPQPMIHVGKIESWLATLDKEDLDLAREVLYTQHPVRADLYYYPSEKVVAILAQVGVVVSPTTVKDHRRAKRLETTDERTTQGLG